MRDSAYCLAGLVLVERLEGWTKLTRVYASQTKVIRTMGIMMMTTHLPGTVLRGSGEVDTGEISIKQGWVQTPRVRSWE